jgi:hypothetical protein
MAYVCESLEIINGVQTCANWVLQNSILPVLTLEQASMLGGSYWFVLVVAKGFRELGYMIKKH